MQETLLALALVVMLGLAASLQPETGLTVGMWIIGAGMALAVPTGLGYHVMLVRTLGARGGLPPGWYWQPVRYHDQLTEGDRLLVLPWFVLGAAGFGVAMVGCGVAVTGLVRMLAGG